MYAQPFLAVLCAVPALAQTLLETLRANGFSKQAELLQNSPVLSAGPGLVVYAATNAALERNRNITVARREITDKDLKEAGGPYSCIKGLNDLGDWPEKRAVLRGRQASFGSAHQTLLSGPHFVNLGPGRNQTLVEKKLASSERPVVFTGLGASSKVTADDIPFDNGASVIRPIGEVLTLPRDLSESLPFVNADKFRAALERVAILPGLDDQATITVLAPSDAAFANTSSLSAAALSQLLKQHILVGAKYPAYTPLLKDGESFSTLGGGTVTVSVRGQEVSFNGVRLLTGDAIITNGVIHTIGKFLPVTPTTVPPPVATSAATTTKALPWWQTLAITLAGITLVAGRCAA